MWLSIVLLAGSGVVAYAVLGAQHATPVSTDIPVVLQVVQVVTAVLYVSAGMLAWCRHPARPIGRLLVAAGLVLLAGGVALRMGADAVFTAGLLAENLFVALLAHTALAYPTGCRLVSTGSPWSSPTR